MLNYQQDEVCNVTNDDKPWNFWGAIRLDIPIWAPIKGPAKSDKFMMK